MAFWHDYYGISVVGNGNDAYDCGYSLVCFVVCCDKVVSPFCFSVFLFLHFPFQLGQNFFVSLSAFLFRLPLFTFLWLGLLRNTSICNHRLAPSFARERASSLDACTSGLPSGGVFGACNFEMV